MKPEQEKIKAKNIQKPIPSAKNDHHFQESSLLVDFPGWFMLPMKEGQYYEPNSERARAKFIQKTAKNAYHFQEGYSVVNSSAAYDALKEVKANGIKKSMSTAKNTHYVQEPSSVVDDSAGYAAKKEEEEKHEPIMEQHKRRSRPKVFRN